MGWKMFRALRFTSESVMALEEDAVEQVSVAVMTDCDAFGQQEFVCLLCVCFTPGPDENPLLWDVH